MVNFANFFVEEKDNIYYYKLSKTEFLLVNKFTGAWAVILGRSITFDKVQELVTAFDKLNYLKTKSFEIKRENFFNTKKGKSLTIIFPNCNLRCKYCYIKNSFSTNDFKVSPLKLIMFCKEFNFNRITFHGGEPLLYFDWIKKFVGLAKELNVHFNYVIQTNGTLLTSEIAEFFKEYDFSVGISLDGPRFVHDANRVFPDGSGSFDKVMRAVKLLKDHHVPFEVLVTMTDLFFEHSKEIITFLKKNNLNYSFNVPFLTKNFGGGEDLLSHLETFLIEYTDHYGFDSAIMNLHGFSSFFTPNVDPNNPDKAVLSDNCGAGINSLAVYSDGSLSFCPLLLTYPKLSFSSNNNFKRELLELRKPLDDRLLTLINPSYTHPFLPLHKNLCPARALIYSKNFNDDYLVPLYENLFLHFLENITLFYEKVPFVHKLSFQGLTIYTLFK